MVRRRSDDARPTSRHPIFINPYAAVRPDDTGSPLVLRTMTGAVLVTGAACVAHGTATADTIDAGGGFSDDTTFDGGITTLDSATFDLPDPTTAGADLSFADDISFPAEFPSGRRGAVG